ncbi:MAG TPA: DUF418 domain-containing protein, partial [Pontimonas sp.]|nr:DUF418 domain-containing protein [Pontimonas sp.]
YFSTSVDSGVTADGVQSAGDAIAAFLVFVLGQGKFYLIFSFLFGYSAHYVLGNQETGRTRWVTRSLGLIALGLAHASLLFIGDILFLYGILALLLLAFYGRTRKTIVGWMTWIYGIFVAVLSALVALTWLGESQGFTDTTPASVTGAAYGEAVATGSFLEAIPARWALWSEEAVFLILFQAILTFVAFLAGILAARSQALSPGSVTPATLRAMMIWGWGLGLGLQGFFGGIWLDNLVSASPTATSELLGLLGGFVTAPLLSMGYVGTMIWLIRTRPRALGWLGSMGRMSLTVYLSQSLLLSLIFGAWGLGLYQEIPYWSAVLISLGVTAVLAIFASLWLSRFRQGPMEKLLTNWSKLFLSQSHR